MKDRIIQLPKIEKKLTIEEQIIQILKNQSLTSYQTGQKINKPLRSVMTIMSNMVRDGMLECVKCPNCDEGRLYRRKNVS